MNNKVIYTAIFGAYDRLQEPEVVPEGFDLVVFTNQSLSSKVWDVRKVKQPLPDPTRSARLYKIKPHEYLPEYDTSIWMDGNMVLKGDVGDVIDGYLQDHSIAVYDRSKVGDNKKIDCLYDEADFLLTFTGIKQKDDPVIIKRQVDAYRKEGYPEHNGLLVSSVMYRHHMHEDCIQAMNAWWEQLEQYSKRDQMSFNYVMWKLQIPFSYIHEDAWDNKYFYRAAHRVPFLQKVRGKIKMMFRK
ncbi:MAG: glycosyltransferase domain-containing protein [Patescibacteria group bacterium]